MIRSFYECPNCGNLQTNPLGKFNEGDEEEGIIFVCACCEEQYKKVKSINVRITNQSILGPWTSWMD